jgi:predicted alpha/beta hydrolase family esterase
MKNAILLHGTSSSPDSYWMPSIGKFLEENGYEVWAPQLPEAARPSLKVQVPFVLKNGKFSQETIIIGHSAGSPLILGVLEKIDIKIKKAILVSGFGRILKNNNISIPLVKKFDWEKIKNSCDKFIMINSDNDPWGCDDREGYYMFKKLGGKLIILHGEGHMGSDHYKQPYKEFPLLEKMIEL